jgi:peptidoglycan LD-endopeptidase LytH
MRRPRAVHDRTLRRFVVLSLLAAAGAACERGAGLEGERVDGSAGSGPEAARGVLDTAPLPPSAPEVAPDSARVPSIAPAHAPAGDTVFAVTPDELAALSAELDVPVAGVRRSQLRDTYTEARGDRVHEALDIAAPRGTPVLSATHGRVLRLFDSRPGGLMVYATDASERFILLYGHLDGYAPGLTDGAPLTRGQVIGYVGSTGNARADAPHLHFGILRGRPAQSWSTGIAVNPYPLLVRDSSSP